MRAHPIPALLLATLILALGSPAAAEGPAWHAQLNGTMRGQADGTALPLALLRADYRIDVLGSSVLGTLEQEFLNDGDDIDATYGVRPPAGFTIERIEVEVAGQAVDDPVRQSKKPAKADRSTRPFAVESAATVRVRTEFRAQLPLVSGRFGLSLPPVLDARAAPVAGAIEVRVHHREPLPAVESPTHEIFVEFEGNRSRVALVEGDSAGRPFRLDFALGREHEPTLLGFVGPERDGLRDVMVVLTPAVRPPDASVRAKQVLFVLDTSGSMSRGKLEQAKLALASCLDKLGDSDRFNVLEFDSAYTVFRDEPVPVAEIDAAVSWLGSQRASGSTKPLAALAAAFEQSRAEEQHAMIVLLTDGIIAEEPLVLKLLEEKLGDGRLFVVGIGEDVRQETILRIAEYGRGVATFATDPESLDAALATMFDSVSAPLAWDLALDWGGARVEHVEPNRLPDLYAGRPVTIRARIRGDLPEAVQLAVSTTDGAQTFVAPIADAMRPERLPEFAREPGKGKPTRSKRR